MTVTESTQRKAETKRLWTYDEMVAELPETNQPVELWNGEIIMSPSPTPKHQRIVGRFYQKLDFMIEKQRLGQVLVSPMDVVLTQHRVVQPDVIFISQSRLSIIKNCVDGVPDLAMEAVSQTSWHRDRIEKKALYEQAGLPEYWIVDADNETIEVFVLEKGVYQLHSRAIGGEVAKSRIIPGFEISFKELLG